MYYVHTKYKTMEGEPHLGYQIESDLIEADGEAEELFLQQTVDNQWPEQNFIAIDWVSEDEIYLDIADYINQNTYDLFAKIIEDQEQEFSYTKAHSYYWACIRQTSRRRRK